MRFNPHRQNPGESRQYQKLSQRADQRPPWTSQSISKIRDSQIQRNAEHYQPRITFRSRSEPGLKLRLMASIPIFIPLYLPFGSRCIALKCRRPGAHICFTGSTSACMTTGPGLAFAASSAFCISSAFVARIPLAPILSAEGQNEFRPGPR